MINADQIGTNPAPGVMATRPTTRPVQAPTSVGLPSFTVSMSIQDRRAVAADTDVVINA